MSDELDEYMAKRKRIDDAVALISEGEALDWKHAIERRFNWQGTTFCAEDIVFYHKDKYEDRDDYTPLTDEQLQAVMKTRLWLRAMSESLCEHGYEIIDLALDEVLKGE